VEAKVAMERTLVFMAVAVVVAVQAKLDTQCLALDTKAFAYFATQEVK